MVRQKGQIRSWSNIWECMSIIDRTIRNEQSPPSTILTPRIKSNWPCFHGSRRISFVVTLCWTCVSRMGTGWSQLGGCLCNWNIWMCAGTDYLFWFQDKVGSSFHSLCSTTQILSGFPICVVCCTWCISPPGFYKRKLCVPTSSNFCIGGLPGSYLLLLW